LERSTWNQDKAEHIIQKLMLSNDAFSQWMGIEVVEISPITVILSMVITEEMTNGFGIAHGGIIYSVCDSALAFASNAYGRQAVSIETSISHLKPLKIGNRVTVTSYTKRISGTLGHFEVLAHDQTNALVGIFKGTVFYNGKEWNSYVKNDSQYNS